MKTLCHFNLNRCHTLFGKSAQTQSKQQWQQPKQDYLWKGLHSQVHTVLGKMPNQTVLYAMASHKHCYTLSWNVSIYRGTRKPFMKKFEQGLTRLSYTIPSNRLMLKSVLDPLSLLRTREEKQEELECHTRRMCFTLHNKRCIILGSPSPYVTTVHNV